MYLTPAQLSQLRTRPHRTQLFLSIFRPRTVFATQINQPGIVKSTRDITVASLSGSSLSVVSGMTVYIGTSQGAKDVGRIRIRSATSTVLTLAENSIDWEDGWFLTVVRYFEPWGVFPRIILDSNNNPIFYKDWDDTYGNQNEVMDPVVCLGPNDAGLLNQDEIAPTGSHRVWYTSSGSYDPTPGGTLNAYLWHFEGGTPTGSTAADPGYVTYTGIGNFVTSLTVTTTAGKSFTGRRHIRVMARPENAGSEKPANAWGLGGLAGDRESGGYTGDIWMREPADPENIVDGALVVIFSEDFEGGVSTKVGANAENRGYIFFVGYILEDSIGWNPETNVSRFSVGGTSARMAELSTFFTALDDKVASKTDTWTDHYQLTVDRALAHFLRYHSTVLAVADFSPTLDTLPLKGADLGRGNVREVANSFIDSALGAQLISDRQGKLWAEVQANLRPTGTDRQPHGHMQNVIEITSQDWRSEIAIERRGDSSLAYLEMSGVVWSGATTGTFDAYLSGAPGAAPDYFGSATRIGNLALLGQNQLNQLAGNAWADASALYPRITSPMAGDYRFIDIAPQHRIQMTLAAADTWRQIVMTQKPFIPNSISYEYRPADQMLLMELDTKEETFGGPGETIVIPVEPPYNRPILPDWDIDFPPIVPPDPIEPPIEPPPGSGDLVYIATTNRLARSRDFAIGRATGSSWTNITPTFGGSSVTGTFKSFRLDPQDPANTAYLMTEVDGGGDAPPDGPYLYRINNLGGPTGTQTYTELLTPSTLEGILGALGNQLLGNDFGVSAINSNVMFLQGRTASIGAKAMIVRSADGGSTWVDATGDLASSVNQPNTGFIWPSEKGTIDVLAKLESDRELWYSNTQGNLWTKLRDLGGQDFYQIHIPFNGNPADQIIYASWEENSGQVVLTRDRFSTELDITPSFDGERWQPAGFGGQGFPERQTFSTWYLNRLLIAAVMKTIGGANRNVLFYATDGVDGGVTSWLPRFEFPSAGGANNVFPFEWHRTNADIMAATQRGSGNNANIWLSVDGGLSFLDGIVNWESDIGAVADIGFIVRALRFVWTT